MFIYTQLTLYNLKTSQHKICDHATTPRWEDRSFYDHFKFFCFKVGIMALGVGGGGRCVNYFSVICHFTIPNVILKK